MLKDSPLLETAAKIVCKQPYLADWLFDNFGHIREEQHRQIMAAAKLIYEQNIKRLSGVQITDVILTGSYANYYYSEDDDVDIILMLNFDQNRYIKKEEAALEDFLFLSNHLGSLGLKLYLNDRDLQVNSAIKLYNSLGQYSVKNKKWINLPEFETETITVDELIGNYYDKMSAFYQELQSYPLHNGKYSSDDCRKLTRRYMYRIFNFDDLKDYLTYKLLRKTGRIREIRNQIREIYASSLTYLP